MLMTWQEKEETLHNFRERREAVSMSSTGWLFSRARASDEACEQQIGSIEMPTRACMCAAPRAPSAYDVSTLSREDSRTGVYARDTVCCRRL